MRERARRGAKLTLFHLDRESRPRDPRGRIGEGPPECPEEGNPRTQEGGGTARIPGGRKGTHGPGSHDYPGRGRPRSDFASPGNGEAGSDTVVLRVALVMRGGQIGAELTPDKGRDLSPRLKDGRRGRTRVSSPKWWTGHDYWRGWRG